VDEPFDERPTRFGAVAPPDDRPPGTRSGRADRRDRLASPRASWLGPRVVRSTPRTPPPPEAAPRDPARSPCAERPSPRLAVVPRDGRPPDGPFASTGPERRTARPSASTRRDRPADPPLSPRRVVRRPPAGPSPSARRERLPARPSPSAGRGRLPARPSAAGRRERLSPRPVVSALERGLRAGRDGRGVPGRGGRDWSPPVGGRDGPAGVMVAPGGRGARCPRGGSP
jgi:hypothetical protein